MLTILNRIGSTNTKILTIPDYFVSTGTNICNVLPSLNIMVVKFESGFPSTSSLHPIFLPKLKFLWILVHKIFHCFLYQNSNPNSYFVFIFIIRFFIAFRTQIKLYKFSLILVQKVLYCFLYQNLCLLYFEIRVR